MPQNQDPPPFFLQNHMYVMALIPSDIVLLASDNKSFISVIICTTQKKLGGNFLLNISGYNVNGFPGALERLTSTNNYESF